MGSSPISRSKLKYAYIAWIVIVWACGTVEPPINPNKPVIPLKYRVESLDPVISTDEASGIVLSFINKKLFRYSPQGVLQNELAVTESRSGWIVSLKIQDIGYKKNKLTAKDAAYSLNRLKHSGKQGWVLDKLKRISARGDILLLELIRGKRNPWAEWQGQKIKLSLPQASIYSEKIHREEGRFDSLNGVTIRENSQSMLSIDTVEFPVLPDETARWFFFQSGKPDIYEANGIFRFLRFPEEKYALKDVDEFIVLYAALTAGKSPNHILGNKNFRQYLNRQFPRKILCEKTLLSACVPADYPVPNGLHEVLPEMYMYSPSAYTGPGQRSDVIKIFTNADRERQLITFVIKDILEKIPVKTEIVVTDIPSIVRFSNDGEPGIYLMKWAADYPHAENFLFPLFFSENAGTGGNRSWYKNKRVDTILTTTSYTRDDITKIQNIVREDAPWLFIGFMKQHFFVRKHAKVNLPSSFAGWGPSLLRSF